LTNDKCTGELKDKDILYWLNFLEKNTENHQFWFSKEIKMLKLALEKK